MCVGVCVLLVCVCMLLVFCHQKHLDPEIRIYRNREETFIALIFAENASFRI